MLEVFFYITPNSIDKSLWFTQASVKEGLESCLSDKNVSFVFYVTLVLLSAEQSKIFQKSGRKHNSV